MKKSPVLNEKVKYEDLNDMFRVKVKSVHKMCGCLKTLFKCNNKVCVVIIEYFFRVKILRFEIYWFKKKKNLFQLSNFMKMVETKKYLWVVLIKV